MSFPGVGKWSSACGGEVNHVLECCTNCELASASLMRKLGYFLLAFRNLGRFFCFPLSWLCAGSCV